MKENSFNYIYERIYDLKSKQFSVEKLNSFLISFPRNNKGILWTNHRTVN